MESKDVEVPISTILEADAHHNARTGIILNKKLGPAYVASRNGGGGGLGFIEGWRAMGVANDIFGFNATNQVTPTNKNVPPVASTSGSKPILPSLAISTQLSPPPPSLPHATASFPPIAQLASSTKTSISTSIPKLNGVDANFSNGSKKDSHPSLSSSPSPPTIYVHARIASSSGVPANASGLVACIEATTHEMFSKATDEELKLLKLDREMVENIDFTVFPRVGSGLRSLADFGTHTWIKDQRNQPFQLLLDASKGKIDILVYYGFTSLVDLPSQLYLASNVKIAIVFVEVKQGLVEHLHIIHPRDLIPVLESFITSIKGLLVPNTLYSESLLAAANFAKFIESCQNSQDLVTQVVTKITTGVLTRLLASKTTLFGLAASKDRWVGIGNNTIAAIGRVRVDFQLSERDQLHKEHEGEQDDEYEEREEELDLIMEENDANGPVQGGEAARVDEEDRGSKSAAGAEEDEATDLLDSTSTNFRISTIASSLAHTPNLQTSFVSNQNSAIDPSSTSTSNISLSFSASSPSNESITLSDDSLSNSSSAILHNITPSNELSALRAKVSAERIRYDSRICSNKSCPYVQDTKLVTASDGLIRCYRCYDHFQRTGVDYPLTTLIKRNAAGEKESVQGRMKITPQHRNAVRDEILLENGVPPTAPSSCTTDSPVGCPYSIAGTEQTLRNGMCRNCYVHFKKEGKKWPLKKDGGSYLEKLAPRNSTNAYTPGKLAEVRAYIKNNKKVEAETDGAWKESNFPKKRTRIANAKGKERPTYKEEDEESEEDEDERPRKQVKFQ